MNQCQSGNFCYRWNKRSRISVIYDPRIPRISKTEAHFYKQLPIILIPGISFAPVAYLTNSWGVTSVGFKRNSSFLPLLPCHLSQAAEAYFWLKQIKWDIGQWSRNLYEKPVVFP